MFKWLLIFIGSINLFAFSTTNIGYLYGKFDGNSYVFDTKDSKSTITIEHYSNFEYGDVFFFIDFARGDFKYQDKTHDVYGEIDPRISLSKVMSRDLSFSIIKDIYLSGQHNQGEDYRATLIGLGVDLKLPYFSVFGLNLFDKNQNIGDDTIQLSANYTLPFNIKSSKFSFEGFFDLTEDDFLIQNQFLYSPIENIKVGCEWHYYKSDKEKSNVPQFIIKWIW